VKRISRDESKLVVFQVRPGQLLYPYTMRADEHAILKQYVHLSAQSREGITAAYQARLKRVSKCLFQR
jgi:hypothetical protein